MARKYASDDANLNVGSIFTSRNRDYSDINMYFEPNPNTGDIYKVKDANSVKQSVRNIVLTNFYERPFSPFIGGNLHSLLFENITPFTINNAKDEITKSINNYESRAEVLDINISSDGAHSLLINLVIRVKETRQIQEINITLERLR